MIPVATAAQRLAGFTTAEIKKPIPMMDHKYTSNRLKASTEDMLEALLGSGIWAKRLFRKPPVSQISACCVRLPEIYWLSLASWDLLNEIRRL